MQREGEQRVGRLKVGEFGARYWRRRKREKITDREGPRQL